MFYCTLNPIANEAWQRKISIKTIQAVFLVSSLTAGHMDITRTPPDKTAPTKTRVHCSQSNCTTHNIYNQWKIRNDNAKLGVSRNNMYMYNISYMWFYASDIKNSLVDEFFHGWLTYQKHSLLPTEWKKIKKLDNYLHVLTEIGM